MLRKMFAALLALALALCCVPAMAESTEYTAYTHPNQGYSLEYPSDYLALDSETVSLMMSIFADGGIEGLNFDFSQVSDQIEAMDIVMFYHVSGNNVNVVVNDVGLPFPASLLVSLVLPSNVEQYKGMLPGCEFYDEGSVVQYGESEFAHLGLTYSNGINSVFMEQYMVVIGTTLYNFTFTYNGEIPTDVVEHMLSTFTPPEA